MLISWRVVGLVGPNLIAKMPLEGPLLEALEKRVPSLATGHSTTAICITAGGACGNELQEGGKPDHCHRHGHAHHDHYIP